MQVATQHCRANDARESRRVLNRTRFQLTVVFFIFIKFLHHHQPPRHRGHCSSRRAQEESASDCWSIEVAIVV